MSVSSTKKQRPRLTHVRSEAIREIVALLDVRMGVVFNDFTPKQRRAVKVAKVYLSDLVRWGSEHRNPRPKRKTKVAA